MSNLIISSFRRTVGSWEQMTPLTDAAAHLRVANLAIGRVAESGLGGSPRVQ